MILGLDEIRRLNLVEGVSEHELKSAEGAGIELRAGKVFELDGKEQGFLHIEERKSPSYKLLAEYDENKSEKIKILPGKTYIVQTVERINTPLNIVGRMYPRATLFTAGILVQGQKTDPGYRGTFQFVFINLSGQPFELELGARIAKVMFHEVKGETSAYAGQWQGGRPFIKEKEKQN